MEHQNRSAQAPSQEGEKRKKRALLALLVLLLLLALFSSVIVGFLIGRHTGPARGQILDTILIGPDENRKVHLAGQVRYVDGPPYSNGVVELRSDPRMAETDEQGRFFYEQVPLGDHTLSVIGKDGGVLATCELAVGCGSGEQPVHVAKLADGQYTVELSADVRFIELAVELDGSRAALDLIPEATAVLTDSGTLTVQDRELDSAQGAIVLPSGTVILPDRTVVAPGYLILPNNAVTPIPDTGYTTENGETIGPDGTVILPDETVITPEGIRTPAGETVRPQEPYQIAPQEQTPASSTAALPPSGPARRPGTAEQPAVTPPAGGPGTGTVSPDSSSSPAPDSSSGAPSSSSSAPQDSSSTPQDSSSTPQDSSSTPQDSSSTPPDSSSTPPSSSSSVPPSSSEPEDDDPGTLQAQQNAAEGWTPWESESEIDLFYDRTGTAENGSIQPGSKGAYQFRLVNTRQTALTYSITLSEGSFHLPMRFRLIQEDGTAGKWQTMQTGRPLPLGGGTVGEAPVILGIEWEWLYESGDDAADTAAGTAQDCAYLVDLKIHAE